MLAGYADYLPKFKLNLIQLEDHSEDTR